MAPVSSAYAQEEVAPTEGTPTHTESPTVETPEPINTSSFTDLVPESTDENSTATTLPTDSSEQDNVAPENPTAEINSQPEATPEETLVPTNEEETQEEKVPEENQQQMLIGGGSTPPTANDPTFTYKSIAPQVDKTSGALVQSLPLYIPPGRNGLQPNIALTYNSQQLDEGIVGYGWNINIPYIERMNRQGTNKMYVQDYFYSSLGGSGELASTTVSNEYRAKVETGDFLKYTFASTSASSSWTVYDKKGIKYTFGITAQARQDNASSPDKVFRWMLEEVRDTNNNFIRFTYYKDQGQIYPDTVYYTGSGATDGIFTILFSREARSDTVTSYKSSFLVKTNYRINKIEAKVNGTWVHKYDLSYTTGNNTKRSLLQSVIESGQTEDGVSSFALPALTFQYINDSVTFSTVNPPLSIKVPGGAYIAADTDGNGLLDVNCFKDWNTPPPNQKAYVELNYNNAIQYGGFYDVAEKWADSNCGAQEYGTRYLDFNGDGKADILKSFFDSVGGSGSQKIYWNISSATSGISWSLYNATPTMPYFISSGATQGIIGNINGDGVPDFEKAYGGSGGAYFGNGTTGFPDSGSFAPVGYLPIAGNPDTADNRLIDINGDGLDDWMLNSSGNITFSLNTGSGWGTSYDSQWTLATTSVTQGGLYTPGIDKGVRFLEINGDGLLDYVRAYSMPAYPSGSHVGYSPEIGETYEVKINTGSGWATSTISLPRGIVFGSTVAGYLESVTVNEMWDWSGDGLADGGTGLPAKNNARKPDMLKQINYPAGGYTSIEYTPTTAQLKSNGSDNIPKHDQLPFIVYTVTKVSNNDANSNLEDIAYAYENGSLYFNSPYDRKIAGFETITETRADGITKNYYHQGNASASTTYEFNDHYSKIGKPYREDVTDISANLYKRTFYTWDNFDQGNGRNFVYLSTTSEQMYDGNASHKDKATKFVYATSTGDVIQIIQYGEVTGNTDGTFTDTGSDLASTTISYTASTSVNMRLPYQQTTNNQSASKIKETRFYYDNLSLGNANSGNVTKEENWITGSSYASTTKVYNSYGLVTSEKDPRAKNTSYTYDSNNLYVATATNPLSQNTGFLYDYSSGKVKQLTDPNNRVFKYVFDSLDRLTDEQQPDLTTPTTLVSKAQYTYYTTAFPNYVQKTSYLNSATSSEFYTYLDGIGRKIQERKEVGGINNFAVRDSVYGNTGKLIKESLPYFASSTAYTTPTSQNALYSFYTYDALSRVVVMTNSVGTTTTGYDNWNTRVTDANSKYKDYLRDAYGNLTQVTEWNNGIGYITAYDYDRPGNLLKITDALGNIRNFTYDGLNRRLTSEDLHTTGDALFGTSTYTYDLSGNLTSFKDPKNQTINYTYDDLNRVLTEDYTGQTGTETTYQYDSCGLDGKGRLCAATTTPTAVYSTYDYNDNGGLKKETKKILNVLYVTQYDYDRQGNTTLITYPDNSQTQYLFNDAGRITAVNYRNGTSATYSPIISKVYYSPLEQPTYIRYGNNVESIRTYDQSHLYRLINILTVQPGTSTEIGYDVGGGLGLLENSRFKTLAKAGDAFPLAIGELSTSTLSNLLSQSELGTSTWALELKTAEEGHIYSAIKTAPATERANIKGREISKIKNVPRIKRKDYDIEIISTQPIEGGVEAFVRAWKKDGEQVGFGEDGSIEIQRFRIFNPPILVADPKGNIVQEVVNEATGKISNRYLREDHKEALLQIIEHDLSVMTGIHGSGNIIEGKRGHTISTFYSQAGSGGTSMDGRVQNAGGTFSQVWSGAGTYSIADGATADAVGIDDVGDTGFNYYLKRMYWTFNTSALASGTPVSSSTFSIYGDSSNGKTNDDGSAWTIDIVKSTQAAANNLVNADYGAVGTTSFAQKTYSSISTSGYNNFYLNASGIANISTTSATKFAARISFDINFAEPNGQSNRAYFLMTDQSGTTQDPVLIVEDSTPNDAPLAPVSLLAEGATNPFGIFDPTPELSAVYKDPNAADNAMSYQIQVATSTSFTSVYWDSLQTALASATPQGSRIADIPYTGPLLASSTMYYWRIKFWDDSSSQGAWSTTTSSFYLSATSSSLILQSTSYTYDAVGNILSVTENAPTNARHTSIYAYDDLNRLLSASTTVASSSPYRLDYTYNAAGNILSVTSDSSGSQASNSSSVTFVATSSQYASKSSPSNMPTGSGARTLEVWLKATTAGDTGYVGAFGSSAAYFGLYVMDTNHIMISTNESKNHQWTATNVSDGNWHHIAVSYASGGSISSDTDTKAYMDGTLLTTSSATGGSLNTGSGTLMTGASPEGGAYWNGKVDEMRVWNVVRTQSEISSNMTANLTGAESGLVGYHRFESNYSDQTSSGNTLTAVNSPAFSSSTPYGATSGTMTSYTYAQNGYTNPHAATKIGNKNFAYDNNGNLTNATGTGTTTNTWDWRNRLTKTVMGTTTNYTYDENNTRVYFGSATSSVVYPNRLYNRNATTTKTTRQIFLGDFLVASIESATSTGTTTYYVHTDHLGGTSVITNASGTAVQVSDYYPYGGERINTQTNGFKEQRKYAGTEFDPDSLYNFMEARYYDSGRGSFISQDPVFWEVGLTDDGKKVLLNPQQMNSYNYAGGNPIVNKDPTGRILDTIVDAGFIAYDTYKVAQAYTTGGNVREQMGYLGLDLAGAALPGVTGLGVAGRMAKVSDEAYETIQQGRRVQTELGFPKVKVGEMGGDGAGKKFTQNVKDQIKDSLCVFCGSKTVKTRGPLQKQVDHSIPKVQGGNNSISNAQVTCRTCNLQKGSMTSQQFVQKLSSLRSALESLAKSLR